MPPAGDVFGLDGFFLNVSNPVVVSTIGINSIGAPGAGISVTSAAFTGATNTATLTFQTNAGLSTTPFYTGAKIAVSGVGIGYDGTFIVSGFAGTTTVSYATTGYFTGFGGIPTSIPTILSPTYVVLVTDTQVINTTWSSAQTQGYFAGGGSLGGFSTVDRIDFSNDTGTANIRGSLSIGRSGLTATGNSNYGWFGGGTAQSPPTGQLSSIVDRIDFSNDNGTALVRGFVVLNRRDFASTGNSNFGWFGGGATPTVTSLVTRINFSNDSQAASIRGLLSSARSQLAATGNSNFGWFGGGNPNTSRVDRIDFSNDLATALVRNRLTTPFSRERYAATGNSNYGWFGGGIAPSEVSTVDRIDFANDLGTILIRGPLTASKGRLAATSNSNYGWFGGGQLDLSILQSQVDRINFANDSVTASTRGLLSAARAYLSATSGQARSSSIRIGKTGGYGWFGGGLPSSARVDRIDFSNDLSTASLRGLLSLDRDQAAAVGNSNYGWFGGGDGPTSTVDRINFSNDSSTASVRGPLSLARYWLTATGNSNYGWFGGGATVPLPIIMYSIVDRIDFSNDSATASPRSQLSLEKRQLAATGNFNYGWFSGGAPGPVSRVDRIDFSNDSVTISTRGPLSVIRANHKATGNSNYGWFGGGNTGSPTISSVDRIDFSNDSATASPRGIFITTREGMGAAGNSNYGWFSGDSPSSRVDRIDFSNDSATASLRGALSGARINCAATSNASFS